MTQDKAQAAGAVSIDSNLEFQAVLHAYRNSTFDFAETKEALINNIDAHAAQRYEVGKAEQAVRIKHLTHERDIARAAVKDAEASLARLVEAMNEIIRNDPFNTHNSSIIARAALLPAKAEEA